MTMATFERDKQGPAANLVPAARIDVDNWPLLEGTRVGESCWTLRCDCGCLNPPRASSYRTHQAERKSSPLREF
jgi:hypothetical protein